jgi:hypothetical protein
MVRYKIRSTYISTKIVTTGSSQPTVALMHRNLTWVADLRSMYLHTDLWRSHWIYGDSQSQVLHTIAIQYCPCTQLCNCLRDKTTNNINTPEKHKSFPDHPIRESRIPRTERVNPILCEESGISPNQGWIRNRLFGNPPNWIIIISWHVGGFPDKVGSVDKHWLCTSRYHMYRMGVLHLLISFSPASYLAGEN